MSELTLYEHAEMMKVAVRERAVGLCVTRLPCSYRDRPRLLLLHGNPASMYDFGRLAALLRDDFELAALDLPGFGRSESLRPCASESVLDTYARHVHAVCEQIGWHGPLYVLGHSHGGAVAQALAARFPEGVAGLILLASVGTPAHWGYRQLVRPGVREGLELLVRAVKRTQQRRIKRRIIASIMRPIFAPHPVPDAWLDAQLELVLRRPEILSSMALVARGDPCRQLAQTAASIRAPALFIHGDSDRLVPSVHARAVHEVVARRGSSEFHELPNTGHMLHLSHPAQVRELTLRWRARRTH